MNRNVGLRHAPYVSAVIASGGAAIAAANFLPTRPSESLLVAILGAVVVVASGIVGFWESRRAGTTAALVFFLWAAGTGMSSSLVFGFLFSAVIIYVVPDYTGDIWIIGGTTLFFVLGTVITIVAAAVGAPLAWIVGTLRSGRASGR